MGRRQGVPSDLRSGRPSGAGSRPLRREQGQSSILACPVRLGFRSARALQSNYLAMDKPRPDEEPNCIGFKSQEGDFLEISISEDKDDYYGRVHCNDEPKQNPSLSTQPLYFIASTERCRRSSTISRLAYLFFW